MIDEVATHNNTILSYEELQSVKPMTVNDQKRVEQFIWEVENYELSSAIGRDAYLLMLADSHLEDIPDRFVDIYNGGLREAIAFMVYAKYATEGVLQDTFSGLRTKRANDFGDPADQGAMKNIRTEYRNMAFYFLSLVKDDINREYGQQCSKGKSVPETFDMINIYGKGSSKKRITVL